MPQEDASNKCAQVIRRVQYAQWQGLEKVTPHAISKLRSLDHLQVQCLQLTLSPHQAQKRGCSVTLPACHVTQQPRPRRLGHDHGQSTDGRRLKTLDQQEHHGGEECSQHQLRHGSWALTKNPKVCVQCPCHRATGFVGLGGNVFTKPSK